MTEAHMKVNEVGMVLTRGSEAEGGLRGCGSEHSA